MFYNNSEPGFLNWWDDLDEAPSPGSSISPDDGGSEAEVSPDGTGETSGSGDTAGRFFHENPEDLQRHGSDRVGEESAILSQALGSYDRDLVLRVWEYAEAIPGNDAELWRKDERGNWIYRLDYGRRESEFGWEIFDPGAGRHSQGIYAMRPLQWESFIREYEALG